MAAMLGDVQRVHAFEVCYMARRGRTFQWRDEEIEEVSITPAPGARRSRRTAAPPKPARLGFQNGLLLFTVCSVTMVFAVPALIAVLYVIFSVIFGE